MASRGRGPAISSNDGLDYTHRQRVAAPHLIRQVVAPPDGSGFPNRLRPNYLHPRISCSVLNKSRFKACTMFHYLLFFVMLAKLSADILDKLDIFVLEIEELQIPNPLWWEYVWCLSILATFVGLWATKQNRVRTMQQYIAGIVVFGLIPLIACLVVHFNDVIGYLSYDDEDVDIEDSDIVLWRVSVLTIDFPRHGFDRS